MFFKLLLVLNSDCTSYYKLFIYFFSWCSMGGPMYNLLRIHFMYVTVTHYDWLHKLWSNQYLIESRLQKMVGSLKKMTAKTREREWWSMSVIGGECLYTYRSSCYTKSKNKKVNPEAKVEKQRAPKSKRSLGIIRLTNYPRSLGPHDATECKRPTDMVTANTAVISHWVHTR